MYKVQRKHDLKHQNRLVFRENNLHSREILDVQKQQKSGKWNGNGEPSNRRTEYTVYKLAPESPLMKHHEVHHDESSYDSFHNYETGEFKTNQIYCDGFSMEISNHMDNRREEKKCISTSTL